MRANHGPAERAPRSRLVSIRLTGDEHRVLGEAASRAEIPPARLARVLLLFGLGELERAEPRLDRAIKVSRD